MSRVVFTKKYVSILLTVAHFSDNLSKIFYIFIIQEKVEILILKECTTGYPQPYGVNKVCWIT